MTTRTFPSTASVEVQETDSDEILRAFREAIQSDQVRIELGHSLSFSEGVVPTAVLSVRGPTGKWNRVKGPVLLPPKDGTRADILDMLAMLYRGDS